MPAGRPPAGAQSIGTPVSVVHTEGGIAMRTDAHGSTLRVGRTASGFLVQVEGQGARCESPALYFYCLASLTNPNLFCDILFRHGGYQGGECNGTAIRVATEGDVGSGAGLP